jgi:hypothetical protein
MDQSGRAELETKIRKYRALARQVAGDTMTTRRMTALISELEEKLAAMDTPRD